MIRRAGVVATVAANIGDLKTEATAYYDSGAYLTHVP
jgi:hypothetical protein